MSKLPLPHCKLFLSCEMSVRVPDICEACGLACVTCGMCTIFITANQAQVHTKLLCVPEKAINCGSSEFWWKIITRMTKSFTFLSRIYIICWNYTKKFQRISFQVLLWGCMYAFTSKPHCVWAQCRRRACIINGYVPFLLLIPDGHLPCLQ